MGFQINPQNPILAAPRTAAAELYPPARSSAKSSGTDDSEAPPLPKAGFGEGTASQATAAFVTLGRGLHSARQIVPTVEDLRAELRARLAENRARREEAERARDAREAAAAEHDVEPALSPEPQGQVSESQDVPEQRTNAVSGTHAPAEFAPPSTNDAPGSRLDLSI